MFNVKIHTYKMLITIKLIFMLSKQFIVSNIRVIC